MGKNQSLGSIHTCDTTVGMRHPVHIFSARGHVPYNFAPTRCNGRQMHLGLQITTSNQSATLARDPATLNETRD